MKTAFLLLFISISAFGQSRTFVTINASNAVVSELRSDRPPGSDPTAPLPANIVEVTNRNDGPWLGKIYNKAGNTFTAPVLPSPTIAPVTTKVQAVSVLKGLLEDPPTMADPWTQTQRDQAVYLILLGLFKDLQNGTVY